MANDSYLFGTPGAMLLPVEARLPPRCQGEIEALPW
jgi:hypothetical protein